MKSKSLACVVIVGTFAITGAQEDLPSYFRAKPLPAFLRAKPLEVNAGDDSVRKLKIARFNAAFSEAKLRLSPGKEPGSPSVPYRIGANDQAIVRLFQAELALAKNAGDRERACSNYLEAAKYLEAYVEKYVKAGWAGCVAADVEVCRYLRLDAEIRLVDAKQEAGPK